MYRSGKRSESRKWIVNISQMWKVPPQRPNNKFQAWDFRTYSFRTKLGIPIYNLFRVTKCRFKRGRIFAYRVIVRLLFIFLFAVVQCRQCIRQYRQRLRFSSQHFQLHSLHHVEPYSNSCVTWPGLACSRCASTGKECWNAVSAVVTETTRGYFLRTSTASVDTAFTSSDYYVLPAHISKSLHRLVSGASQTRAQAKDPSIDKKNGADDDGGRYLRIAQPNSCTIHLQVVLLVSCQTTQFARVMKTKWKKTKVLAAAATTRHELNHRTGEKVSIFCLYVRM